MISVETVSLLFADSVGSTGVASRNRHAAVSRDDSLDVVLATAWAAVARPAS
jgi:hypothetical protein